MAVQLPRYQRQVGTSGAGVGVKGDMQTATAEYGAIADFGKTAGDIALSLGQDYLEKQKLISQKKDEAERYLLKVETKNRLDINQSLYNEGLTTRQDFTEMGTGNDSELQQLQKNNSDIFSDPRFAKHPSLRAELESESGAAIAKSAIKGNAYGIRKLQSQGQATVDTRVDSYLDIGDVESALAEINNSPFHSDLQKEEAKIELPKVADNRRATQDRYANPALFIESIDEQLAGGDEAYPFLDKAGLESQRAYAKQILAERQAEASEALYAPNSKYPEMAPEEKAESLNKLLESGGISQKTWKTEMDLVREPKQIDTTSAHISSFLGYQQEMYKAGNNAEKLNEILSRSNGEILPRQMKSDLLQLSTNIQDPTSQYNKAPSRYMNEQLNLAFDGDDVLPDPSGLFGKAVGLVTGGATPKDYDEYRDALVNQAKFTVGQQMDLWLKTDGSGASPQEIERKLADTILSVKEQYSISNLSTMMKTFQPTEDGEATDAVSDEDADAMIERLRSE